MSCCVTYLANWAKLLLFAWVPAFSIDSEVPGSVVSSKAQVEQMHHILDVPIAIHPHRGLSQHTIFSNVFD
jgi:hypothetical protein